MNRLEKGYTPQELNEFMQAVHKAGGKARRTPDGGWEIVDPTAQPKPAQQTKPTPGAERVTIDRPKREQVIQVPFQQEAELNHPQGEITATEPVTQEKRGFWKRLFGAKKSKS
jgi:hypothetical protein